MHFEVQSLGTSKLPATKVRMHRMVHDGAELLKAVEVDPSWVSIHFLSPFFRAKEQNRVRNSGLLQFRPSPDFQTVASAVTF